MSTHYEIESLTYPDGWENQFHINDETAIFSTEADARAFLQEHLEDELEAYNQGELEDISEADEYRIVKVTREVL